MQETFDRDLAILIYDVGRMLRTRGDRAARMHGMTRAQWVILARLERQPGLSQNELAAICEVEPITVGRLIDRLEARGLVARCADPNDRRIRRLKLLPAAKPMIDEITNYRAELNHELTGHLPEEQREHLIATLRHLKELLANDGASTSKLQSAGG